MEVQMTDAVMEFDELGSEEDEWHDAEDGGIS